MYSMIRNLLFQFSAEDAHGVAFKGLQALGEAHRRGMWTRPAWADGHLTQTPFGTLGNPVGLAAGFDKNAEALWAWQALGFGFVELGTVTPLPQPGNPKPRLFRVVENRAIVNRMGFNNDGAQAIADRIKKARDQGLHISIGGNVGKNKDTPLENAAADYTAAAQTLAPEVDYLVINVSSPNTPGLRSLQTKETLEPLVAGVKNVCGTKPLFVKVAPDGFKEFQEGVLKLAQNYRLAGVICGNTLGDHKSAGISKIEEGGLSGAPIHRINLELLRSYHEQAPHLFFIGVGGIDSLTTAESYFKAGARLVQLYSGFVYEGPQLIARIVQGLKIKNS